MDTAVAEIEAVGGTPQPSVATFYGPRLIRPRMLRLGSYNFIIRDCVQTT